MWEADHNGYVWQQHILVVLAVNCTQNVSSKLKTSGRCNNYTTFSIKHLQYAFWLKEIWWEYLNLKGWRNGIKKYCGKQKFYSSLNVLGWQIHEGKNSHKGLVENQKESILRPLLRSESDIETDTKTVICGEWTGFKELRIGFCDDSFVT